MLHDDLISEVISFGATKAIVINIEDVALSDEFRQLCEQNHCGHYCRSWSCPPECGEIHELMAKVKQYKYALVYQVIYPLEDSYDVEGMAEAGHILSDASHSLQSFALRTLKEPFLHLSGPCGLCERCAKLDNLPCRQPDKMLYSLSGFGVDVYNTVKNTELKYVNGQNTVTNFGMLFFSEI